MVWPLPTRCSPAVLSRARAEILPCELRPVPRLGKSWQRWGEPCQACARCALLGHPTQAASSATTRRPDSAAGQLRGAEAGGGLTPPPPFPSLSEEGSGAQDCRPSRAGGWSAVRGVWPPWSGLLRESVLAEVVIRVCWEAQLLLHPAAAFASYRR